MTFRVLPVTAGRLARVAAVALFAVSSEIRRTERARSFKRPHAGDLAPLFRSLVRLPRMAIQRSLSPTAVLRGAQATIALLSTRPQANSALGGAPSTPS